MAINTHVTQEKATSVSRITLLLYGIVVLLALGIGYLLYRNVQLNQETIRQRTQLQTVVQENQLISDRQQLQFGMKTFVWAIRNAMLQNKSGEINEYFNTLVKDRGVQEVLLVDPAGNVTMSTNKKNQGIAFASRYPAYLLEQQAVYFSNKQLYELSAPVNGPNSRLGTLVMFYKPSPILPDSLNAQ
ncbi:hypothetical protein [Spirosoma aerolatum]|uniref:hypothetical protein n=1 Tax=Spirosoma aerolatum TaxID=1211326 RepID=UPI0009AC70C7|nr:hypothetical protein [Spirosoma aerolatum]